MQGLLNLSNATSQRLPIKVYYFTGQLCVIYLQGPPRWVYNSLRHHTGVIHLALLDANLWKTCEKHIKMGISQVFAQDNSYVFNRIFSGSHSIVLVNCTVKNIRSTWVSLLPYILKWSPHRCYTAWDIRMLPSRFKWVSLQFTLLYSWRFSR